MAIHSYGPASVKNFGLQSQTVYMGITPLLPDKIELGDSYSIFFIGLNTTSPSNLTARYVAKDQQSKSNIYKLTWIANNDIGTIRYYNAVAEYYNGSNNTIITVHPNTTSVLMEVPDDVADAQFSVELVDICNQRFSSNKTSEADISG